MLQIFLQLKFHILIDIILYIKQTNKQTKNTFNKIPN